MIFGCIKTKKTIEEGDKALEKGQLSKAIRIFNHILKTDSLNSKALSRLGFVHMLKNDIKLSEKYLLQAIEIDSLDSETFYHFANLLGQQKRDVEAIEYYLKSIELTNDNNELASIYYNLGFTYSILEQDDYAIEYFTKSINISPDYIDAYYNRSISHSIKEDYHAAINDCDIVLKHNKYHAGAYYTRGVAKSNIKQKEDAVKDLQYAIRYGYGKNAVNALNELNEE